MNSGKKKVIKIGSFLFLRGLIRSRKLRQISESPKRHWISVAWSFSFPAFDLKAKTNFEWETLYRSPISVVPSDSKVGKISDSRIFLWVSSKHTKWPSSDFSLIWAECNSSRDLYQTPLVCELFKPVEFASRFSTVARLQSFSEERKGLNIPFFDGSWFGCIIRIGWLLNCWLIKCSASIKWSSSVFALKLVILSCCRLSSGWCFALFCGGELLECSISFVAISALVFYSVMLRVKRVLQGYLLPGSAEFNLNALRVCAEVGYLRLSVLKSETVRDNYSAASYCILC